MRAKTAEELSEKICNMCFEVTAIERAVRMGRMSSDKASEEIKELKTQIKQLENEHKTHYSTSPRGTSPRLLG